VQAYEAEEDDAQYSEAEGGGDEEEGAPAWEGSADGGASGSEPEDDSLFM